MQNPQTLAAAMSLARQFELMEQYTAAPAKGPARGVLGAPGSRLALPTPTAATDKAQVPANQGDGRPAKRLSKEEQEERRRLGLCYNCNEKYTRGHNRVCRRIFHIGGVEISDTDEAAATDEQEAESPIFSLHAVAGVPFGGTLQIAVSLGGTTLVALLDSGSTHNFIAASAAPRTGLTVQPRPRLTAIVANGERITCPGVIRAAPVSVDGTDFSIDLFVMPLAGYDLVLGTQWMATLGPIV